MGYEYLLDNKLVYFWFKTQQRMLSTIDVIFVLLSDLKAKQISQFTCSATQRAPAVKYLRFSNFVKERSDEFTLVLMQCIIW